MHSTYVSSAASRPLEPHSPHQPSAEPVLQLDQSAVENTSSSSSSTTSDDGAHAPAPQKYSGEKIPRIPTSDHQPSQWTEPPWSGWIETTGDALLILEAARQGLIPRVTRRLSNAERRVITSGSVFVFDEDESHIKRWTDGFFWTPSRILGNFLLYHETEKQGGSARADDAALSRPRADGTPGIDRQRERNLMGSLTDSYIFKSDGLVKKTFSVTIGGVTQHLISYYKNSDVETGRLRPPSSIPEIAALHISPEYLDKTHFRIPPKVEVGADGVPRYRGEADDAPSPPPPAPSPPLSDPAPGPPKRKPLLAWAPLLRHAPAPSESLSSIFRAVPALSPHHLYAPDIVPSPSTPASSPNAVSGPFGPSGQYAPFPRWQPSPSTQNRDSISDLVSPLSLRYQGDPAIERAPQGQGREQHTQEQRPPSESQTHGGGEGAAY
ncbi:hypothetical protein HYPSUDRAFT_221157 [Hypholoma sublateritium FD-334 SS-4]|uniref:Gti1/Pac2 family protein n=1 Tax=Hypholoma sublateritium (strain FD-334 SS-4) TaxID=945553 RepID=A0A0D2LN65_HYPSF|nr:hypothetical protein HYPSUDRAFT_221157 [Hypholoma sublateritium FD-334 SS-4]